MVGDIEAKSGIGKASFPDPFFACLYRAQAPYRGCGHGCMYCDGRAEKYYVEGDFARDIQVRRNLPALIAADVKGGAFAREYGAVGIGSGVTDVYQPLEQELGLTRASLAAMIRPETGRADVPIVALTKNDLALRDFDLFSKFPKTLMLVTVTTMDASVAAAIEPGASPPEARLEVIRQAKKAGFMTGVLPMPLCPGISDGEVSVRAVFDAALGAGADFVYPGGLTLRPGRQKDLFVDLVHQRFPGLEELYARVFRENRQSGFPAYDYAAPLASAWARELSERGVDCMPPHRIYRSLLSASDALFVLFCHMDHLYSFRGVDTRPLRAATDKYAEWLKAERTNLRRKRPEPNPLDPFPVTARLDERLAQLCRGDSGKSFEEMCGNERLASLAREIVLEGKYFDYPTLSARE
ncbi:MAG TPA: radical SAM protein [Treponemataceae bacterium]|nr:radical SAM protein [Treponemataceae bacterium]